MTRDGGRKMLLPERATVVEVGPRDGLQSLPAWVGTDVKIELINRLSALGLPVIEVTSFAHPRAVPNLRDAAEVLAGIARRDDTVYRALVPNAKGAERAITCSAPPGQIVSLLVASETYLQRNQHMTVAEALQSVQLTSELARAAQISNCAVIAGAFWDPFEGATPVPTVLDMIARITDFGISEITLAGSLGMEDSGHVFRMFTAAADLRPEAHFAYHVHNLAGLASANVLAALLAGVSVFETSICGIGGGTAMPASTLPVGNMATEDLVYMLGETGVATGLDLDSVLHAARDISALLGISPGSFIARSGSRQSILDSSNAISAKTE